MDSQEILVEKIIALFNRNKGRDLYDVWFLLNSGIELDKKLFKNKIKYEKTKLRMDNIINKKEYERDMSKLTNRVVPYDQVKGEVFKAIDY